ncbi:thioredoxin domain-containing protein 11 isoform X2 [Schistocerca gregaria]|uniref:thioredoxin domain-containing protein 11 isoform X2 n=1 Tax=Schistocerca gregaria TaxID=7010 RepID=UPI00211EF263|nr:thioredoxin domain-containing protein 11 isoform X2 [Schistocerca gregaria]
MYLGTPTKSKNRNGERSRRATAESFFVTNMYFYGRELCFVLAIIITTYAALQNAPPKISKSPPAVPFFPRTSLVADFFQGNLMSAFQRIAECDVSFIMYYAPWDAESQVLRDQFKAITQFYYRQVYFAAINCWQPRSECRQYFTKLVHFPVFIAYTQHGKGIQYRGPKHAANMARFLTNVIRPLVRIEQPNDLQDLLAHHDAVVVGYFNFLGCLGAPGYHTFYMTALKYLEHDSQREVAFAVVTNANAAAVLGVEILPAVSLHLWNETKEYPRDAEFSSEMLMKWILDNIHQVSVWLSPPGVKSLTLSPFVEDGPVLILFTPRNPLQPHNYYYDLLREFGLEYHNCNNNTQVNMLIEILSEHQQESKQNLKRSVVECDYWLKVKHHTTSCNSEKPICVVVKSQWLNHSLPLHISHHSEAVDYCTKTCSNEPHTHSSVFESFAYNTCAHSDSGTGCNENYTPNSAHVSRPGSDIHSATELYGFWMWEQCRLQHWARKLHQPVFPPKSPLPISGDSHIGLACRTNLSLSLIAMDSLQYRHFAEGLGVGSSVETAVVIFNAAVESAYVLEGKPSKGMIVDFVLNYTQGSLKRSLRSSPEFHCDHDNSGHGQKICIPELTSLTFHHFVMNPQEDVVLMYHSPFCAFCHSVAYVFLTVARYFRSVPRLKFARIDGENNDLPWQFTVHHYPSVLFFPAHRKSESRVFPRNLPVTVPNMVAFVLSNTEYGPRRLVAVAGLCAGWGRGRDPAGARDCVARTRRENLAALAATLAEIRATLRRGGGVSETRGGRRLLRRLQHLRHLHLQLGAADYVTDEHILIAESTAFQDKL